MDPVRSHGRGEEGAMVQAKGVPLAAPLLRSAEMAEVLAALVAHGDEAEALVATLAPRNVDALLDELDQVTAGRLPQADASQSLRWILTELHDELGRRFRAARA
jgi:hypothetical protein